MSAADIWSDFEQIRVAIRHNTVDKLKQIVGGLNEECNTHIQKTGRKHEIIDRILAHLDAWRAGKLEDKWTKAKSVIAQVRQNGVYVPSHLGTAPTLGASSMHNSNTYSIPTIVKTPYANIVASNNLARYDPYAPPRKPVTSNNAIPSSSTKSTGSSLKFKESPFFRIDQPVSGIMECPESSGSTDRKQQTISFTLNNDHLTKLKAPGSKYQLRLFCTSSVFYGGAFRSNPMPCPIEFPPTCEVRINNVQLTANLKGLKKKPGTAPPPDIGQNARFSTVSNRIDMVYVNSQQPPQPKKYYLVVMLVEATTVENLVSDLKLTKYKSSDEIRRQMVESLNEDDDIVAGPQKMSLKCPLVFIRINTPCRSSKCVHPQCFDANSWFSVMEQTTSYLCPVCERVLDAQDLIIDGYFDEILKATPDSVEDVIVESNGEWHTTDNEYGSASWRTTNSSASATRSAEPTTYASHSHIRSTESSDRLDIPLDSQILVLDSDEEDEGRVKRELSPYASGSSVTGSVPQTQYSQTQGGGAVIDLTLDSDDDEPPPQPKANGKRKASDNDYPDHTWKKTRVESDLSRNSLSNGTAGSASNYHQPLPSGSLGGNAPVRYSHNGYQATSSQSDFPPYPNANRNSSQLQTRLPGINAILPQGRWA